MVEVAASLIGGRWVVVVLVVAVVAWVAVVAVVAVAGVGGISLEAGYVGGIWEEMGGVGIFVGNVVGASRECPGRERVQLGRGLRDS